MTSASRWAVGFMTMSLVALALTRLHVFNGYVSIAAAIVVARYWPDRESPVTRGPVIAALIFAAYVLAFASPELEAGWDNGVYNVIAQTIARVGWVDVRMPFAGEADQILPPGLRTGYPGIYLGPGEEHAQFNHISPAFRAVFIDIFSDRPLAISSAVLAGLAMFFFAVATKSIAPRAWLVSAVLLGTNAAVIYVSRAALSEPFSLACVGAALIFIIRLMNKPSIGDSILAGCAFGCLMLSRVDGYLFVPFIASTIVALLCRRPAPSLMPASTLLCISIAFYFWSILDLRSNSYQYFSDLWPVGLGGVVIACGGLLALSVAILIWAFAAPRMWGRTVDVVEKWCIPVGKILICLCAAVTIALLLRSVIADQSDLDQYMQFTLVRAPREFTWYTTVPLLAASYFGAWFLVKDRRLPGAAVALPALLTIFLFLVYTRITPLHPWGARRWVPFAFPMVYLLSTAAFEAWLDRSKVTKFVVAGTLVLSLIQQDAMIRHYWVTRNQQGLESAYQAVADDLKLRGAPYYFSTDPQAASVLTFIYGVPTIPLSGPPVSPQIKELSNVPTICGVLLVQRIGSPDVMDWIGARNPMATGCSSGQFFAPKLTKAKLMDGWYPPEPWGSWSKGNASTLVPISLGDVAQLSISAQALITEKHPTQHITIKTLSGRLLGTMNFSSAGPASFQFAVPPDLIAGKEEITLVFKADETISPKAIGLSEDSRELGFGLIDLKLTAPPSSPQ